MKSRLQQHQNKRFTLTIILATLILISLLIFIFFVGIQLVLNASAFIANLTAKPQTSQVQNKSNSFYGKIDIDSIPTATNSAKIIVGGSVLNYDVLKFYINDQLVDEKSMSASDTFSEEIGDLEKGENEVYIIAVSKSTKKEQDSTRYTVIYKDEKPKLEIKEPPDESKTAKQEIRISGVTDKETYVRVNDSPVVVDAQGNFEASIRLKDGENKITIVTQDIAGNTESKTLTVTYQKED
ncbi:hypothetical protein COT62_00125 [Candidatus Roizmanbacteria bacterium CG09_land_8_20_14_0_10_41_9]|uniref:Uncharacterized protein n=1 Tax=Candidatus Roizmanbacteria bacterium CG09_land_8_20_14_0_10_41_9 TaxID=1974850 RepID=A0A2H0WTW5_9BACT|nr:MAG: hypothetical protein COT62_00125 [Candidatus Roizmanbacteria bacterium CG09_land_8_20_14_0_10_41_9]